MKHWMFILISSIILSGKPTLIGQTVVPDSTQKIPLTEAIENVEAEKQMIVDSIKISLKNINNEKKRIQNNKKPELPKVPKTIIKYEIKYIHDTIYVMQVPSDNGTTPKIIYLSIDQKPTVIAELKKPTFFQRLFNRKKYKNNGR